MTRALICHSTGPGVTVQDLGRSGSLAFGLSRGGAADRHALYEGAALLGQTPDHAALELAGVGGVFEPTQDMRVALTGAPMAAEIDGQNIRWNASHGLPAGARLTLGAVTEGSYGYLHLAGGVASRMVLGARSTHLTAGLGQAITAGTVLPIGADPGGGVGMALDIVPRFAGGDLRVTASLQTERFPRDTLERFENTDFVRDARANRMGVKLAMPGQGFHIPGGLQVLSEIIVPGDIQITGDGTPFILIAESQTTGGYPRIATVIPPDLPRAAQAPAGAKIRFRFVGLEEAVEIHRRTEHELKRVRDRIKPLLRDPLELPNLANFQLISGVTSGSTSEEGTA